MDLRIVGLALLITRDFHIPLFHHTYPGNAHDATTLASITETLVARYRLFSQSVEGITLVYDKGNNREAIQARLDHSPYHFVGSLSPAQHADLMRIPRSRFHPLAGDDLEGELAFRTGKHVLGADRTVLVTYNPEPVLAQTGTLLREIRKRTPKLRELQIRLGLGGGYAPVLDALLQQLMSARGDGVGIQTEQLGDGLVATRPSSGDCRPA